MNTQNKRNRSREDPPSNLGSLRATVLLLNSYHMNTQNKRNRSREGPPSNLGSLRAAALLTSGCYIPGNNTTL